MLLPEYSMQLERAPCRLGSLDGLDPMDLMSFEMVRVFGRSGGLVPRDDVVRRLGHCVDSAPPGHEGSTLVCFAWHGRSWVPSFQLGADGFSVLPGPARVIGELATVFNGWEIAHWFASPNLWLGGACPVDLLEVALCDVLGAARADRFIAAG